MTIDVDNTDRVVGLILAFITLAGIVLGWVRWARPRIHNGRKEVVAVRDAILGREAITDSITGKEIAPAVPGMGMRMAITEENLSKLTEAVAKIADSHLRLDEHERRLQVLEDARVERVVTKAESAQAWRAIAAGLEAEQSLPGDDDGPSAA